MINRSDIIIVGAGASGLMAARELSSQGKTVLVLEARNRAGGRIDTLYEGAFSQPAEAGAEFIHGNLPLTLQLLNEANVPYTKTKGEMLRNENGNWKESDEPVENWNELIGKMNELQIDIPFTDFLNIYLEDSKYDALKQSALQYAQGFDAVNPADASTFSLRTEWMNEEEDNYRVEGGYKLLIDFLLTDIRKHNGTIAFDKAVTNISWKENEVNVTTHTGETYRAEKIIITVPLGVLQHNDTSAAGIRFSPTLPEIQKAAQQIGYGNVIKMLFQFSEQFWQKEALFFFSNQKITTWWSQQPSHYPLLTGWVAGTKTEIFKTSKEEDIRKTAVESIANIFGKTTAEIENLITASHIVNWHNDVYAAGAYSYNTIDSDKAKQVLNKPIKNTIYFAGEGLYAGISGGTVEAALVSGVDVAKKITGVHV